MEMSKTTSISPLAALATMFYEPAKAFEVLEPRRYGWLPLALLMVSSIVLLMWYFNMVDIAWLVEQMNSGIKDQGLREKANSVMSKGMLQGIALGSTLVMLPLITTIGGLYLMLVAKFMSKEFSFGKGFALSAWSSVPTLLLFPLGAIQILMSSNNQLSSSELNPLSVNQLFFHYGVGNPLAGPLDLISVTTIWSIVLMVIGFQAWAKASRTAAVMTVLIPYLLVFGGWFAYAMAVSKAL